ncbi:hypothetical protein [Holospora curviuscula]|nr:hypothetical protein [Holospora curviuscula]
MTCWVAQMFLPNISENCGIVMNNTAFHQGKAMQKMIKDADHTLPTSLFS